jgi:dienelactone hydrolase
MKNLMRLRLRLAGLVLVLLAAFQGANAQVQTARYISMTANTNAFYEYLPQGYSSTGTATYPLILFLHGMGELGDGSTANLPKVLRNGPPKLINNGTFPTSFTVNGQTHRFIVISPQFVAWPQSAQIDAVINYAIANYKVDPKRVYITGLSMGGGATWDYAGNTGNYNYVQRTAAIAPICGASSPSIYRARTIANYNLPVWAFHNQGDPTAPVSYTNDYIQLINSVVPAANPQARKTIYPVSGHDAWSQAYNPNYRENGMNMYEWMLQYQRTNPPMPGVNTPPTVNAGADKTITLPVNSTQLTGSASDPGGSIAGYAWTKTAGPATFTFSSTTVAAPTVSNLVAGTYTFRLTATDNQGATSYDNVNVVVNPAVPANTPPTANAGADVNLVLPTNAVQLSGSGTDANGTIAGYAWTKTAGPTQYAISSATVNNPTISNLVAGTYTFRLTVTDNNGATGFDDISIVVTNATTPPTGGTKLVKVNVFGGTNPYNNAEWNNWNIGTGGKTNVTSAALKYSDGTSSTITANLSQSTSIGDNAATYTGGMAPAEVLRYTSYSTVARNLTIAGLAPSQTYKIELYASRMNVTNNKTIFSSGSARDTVNTDNNHSDVGVLTLTSDATGKIVIAINRTNIYTYLNGFIITENPSGSQSRVAAAAETEKAAVVSSMDVFPNPFQDRLVLQINNGYTGAMKVQLVDMSGIVRKEFNLSKNQAGATQTYLSTGNLPTGEYVLVVTIGNWTESRKVSKL